MGDRCRARRGARRTRAGLIGVDINGTQSWQTPQPIATGTSRPVGLDGALTLSADSGGECVRTTFATFDRTTVTTSPGLCADSSATSAPVTQGGPIRVTAKRSDVWWWPFGDGRPTLEVSGRHTARVVSREAVRSLRADDEGLTVLDGNTVRRYAWVSDG